MRTLLPEWYVLEPVTDYDLVIATLAWGFTLGIGWLTTWTAAKQTKQVYKRRKWGVLRNAYIWMIWLEILVCAIFGIICFLYLRYVIPPSFAFYFVILTTWALQVQFLLQIIVNRCGILLTDRKKARRLKIVVAVLITAVNISVYNIWIPARLQISQRYIHINQWWDRCEKVIYLIVDGCLNFYFIYIVRSSLVKYGLTKYRTLVKFNIVIVWVSLSMDLLIITMMSLPNTFVYMQFHPLAYLVKLNIEMSMADLIGKIARNRYCGIMTVGDIATGPSDVTDCDPTNDPNGSSSRDHWSQIISRGHTNPDHNIIELERGQRRDGTDRGYESYRRALKQLKPSPPPQPQDMRRRSHPGIAFTIFESIVMLPTCFSIGASNAFVTSSGDMVNDLPSRCPTHINGAIITAQKTATAAATIA